MLGALWNPGLIIQVRRLQGYGRIGRNRYNLDRMKEKKEKPMSRCLSNESHGWITATGPNLQDNITPTQIRFNEEERASLDVSEYSLYFTTCLNPSLVNRGR